MGVSEDEEVVEFFDTTSIRSRSCHLSSFPKFTISKPLVKIFTSNDASTSCVENLIQSSRRTRSNSWDSDIATTNPPRRWWTVNSGKTHTPWHYHLTREDCIVLHNYIRSVYLLHEAGMRACSQSLLGRWRHHHAGMKIRTLHQSGISKIRNDFIRRLMHNGPRFIFPPLGLESEVDLIS